MATARKKPRTRRDIHRRMDIGDKIIIEAKAKRRRVRVQVDEEGVTVEHVKGK